MFCPIQRGFVFMMVHGIIPSQTFFSKESKSQSESPRDFTFNLIALFNFYYI